MGIVVSLFAIPYSYFLFLFVALIRRVSRDARFHPWRNPLDHEGMAYVSSPASSENRSVKIGPKIGPYTGPYIIGPYRALIGPYRALIGPYGPYRALIGP